MSSTATHTLPSTTWESVLAEQFPFTPFFSYWSSCWSVITLRSILRWPLNHSPCLELPRSSLCQTFPQQPRVDVSSCWDTLGFPAPVRVTFEMQALTKDLRALLEKTFSCRGKMDVCSLHFAAPSMSVPQHKNLVYHNQESNSFVPPPVVLRSLKLLLSKMQGRTQVTSSKIHSSGFLIKPRKSTCVLADG